MHMGFSNFYIFLVFFTISAKSNILCGNPEENQSKYKTPIKTQFFGFGVKMHMGSQFFIFFWFSSRFLQNPIFCVGILKKIKENIKKHKNSIFGFRSQDAHGFLNFLYFFGFLHDFCKIQYFVWKSWRKSRKIIKTWKLHFWIRWWHLCPDPNFQNHQTPDSASWLLLFTSPLL